MVLTECRESLAARCHGLHNCADPQVSHHPLSPLKAVGEDSQESEAEKTREGGSSSSNSSSSSKEKSEGQKEQDACHLPPRQKDSASASPVNVQYPTVSLVHLFRIIQKAYLIGHQKQFWIQILLQNKNKERKHHH